MPNRPHIVMIIPRGEAVRNFLYSDTLRVLSQNARVTLLSVIHDAQFRTRFEQYASIIALQVFKDHLLVGRLRHITDRAHFRWLWTGVARNRWEIDDFEALTRGSRLRRLAEKGLYRLLACRTSVEFLTQLENVATTKLRPTNHFHELFRELKPDLVFNTSHVHGPAAILPIRAAHDLGIRTVGFVFSWDNLSSRSRIFEPYDDFLVWNDHIKAELLGIYSKVKSDRVHVTGTPQFDFHFRPENWLSRDELAKQVGFDASRPFILYTTGIDNHFPEEHRTVALVIHLLRDLPNHPQLVVRTYVKGTSEMMKELVVAGHQDVFFPPMEWDNQWYMPTDEDQVRYTSMLRECVLGINAASTVSLELMMHHKPVINLGFDPPGSDLPHHMRWSRHTDEFDHYIPVMKSGAVMVVRSERDMREMLTRALKDPKSFSVAQSNFLNWMFGDKLDGFSGKRIADKLIELSQHDL